MAIYRQNTYNIFFLNMMQYIYREDIMCNTEKKLFYLVTAKKISKGTVEVALPPCPSNFNCIIEDSNVFNNNVSDIQITGSSCSSNVEFIEYPKVFKTTNENKNIITSHNGIST